jgi:hypothetical protein
LDINLVKLTRKYQTLAE